MNIIRIFQRWLRELNGNAREGRAVRQQRRARSNSAAPTRAAPQTRPAIPGPARQEKASSPERATAAVTSLTWLGPGESSVVAGRDVGGMIYLGPHPSGALSHRLSRPVIVPTLPVAPSGPDVSGNSMPYWPGYFDISPQARAAYLDWLASGRSDRRYGVGHVFLYFYGLERRFFIDSPDSHERRMIIEEVERLVDVYGDNRSVHHYLEAFLDAARTSMGSDQELKPTYSTSGYELPLGLRVAIGRRAGNGQTLDADWALSWYYAHPDYTFRTAASRASSEFQALFRVLFAERYPLGLKIPLPKRTLRAEYRAASSEFEIGLDEQIGTVPDISRISQPLNATRTLVEEATDALDKYSRYLGRNPDGRGTIEAHALLPERLWHLFPSAEMDSLKEWTAEVIASGGFCPVEELVRRLEGASPESIGKRQLTDAADALARLSVGMAPDPRFALRSPKAGEPVVLFDLPEGMTRLDSPSERYRGLLLSVAIGSFITQADEVVGASELSALSAVIDSDSHLPEGERLRLKANLKWMMSVKPDLPLLRRHLRDAPGETAHEMGQLALSIAASDGVISGREVAALERLYEAIGLEKDGIYSALHALTSVDEPVTVIPPSAGDSGFAIPPKPAIEGSLKLDEERIASVMANTARVSAILGEVFQDDEAVEPQEEHASEGEFDGLDRKHGAFLGELISRPRWDDEGFRNLAHQFRLLPGGAMETVNEWSYERYGDLLVEEDDGYHINSHVRDGILAVAG